MAIALHHPPHRVAPRARWVRQQTTEPSSILALLMVALLMVGIMTVVLTVQALQTTARPARGFWEPSGAPARPTDGAVPAARTVTASAASAAPTAPASASAAVAEPGTPTEAAASASASEQASVSAQSTASLVVGQRAHVAHTDGVGVVLHTTPSQSSRRPAGLMEGTKVTVLDLSGTDWVRVESDSKQSGWVPAAFVVAD